MEEIWKDISGYEGFYAVSNLGRVKRLKRWNGGRGYKVYEDYESIMRQTDNGHGYLIVGLRHDKKRKNHYVHRLVAQAFLDNPHGYKVVNHIDYDKHNNQIDNLEWCTQRKNIQHSAINMRKPIKPINTNTGERYITYRANRDKYRVIIKLKEYGSFKTLEEAIKKRNEVLKNTGYAKEIINMQ